MIDNKEQILGKVEDRGKNNRKEIEKEEMRKKSR